MSFYLLLDFVRYLAVGGFSAVTDFSIFSLLTRRLKLHPVASHTISRPLGGLVCFFLNKYWTFGKKNSGDATGQFIKFWFVFAASLGLSTLLLWLFLKFFPRVPEIAKALAEGIVVIFNFLCLKYWTFQ